MKNIINSKEGELKRSIGVIVLIAMLFFLFYGINPFAENMHYFGFGAWAYTVTCSIASITEGTNPNYQYANNPYEYYNTAVGGTFNVTVTASTDDPSGIKNVTFPTTVSAGGADTSSLYIWTYTWTTSSTYSSSATTTCYSYWGSSGGTTLYVYRDITAPVLTFTSPTLSNNSATGNNYTQINMTIYEAGAGLDTFKFNWNLTNYSFYDSSLVLAMNFNNLSLIHI